MELKRRPFSAPILEIYLGRVYMELKTLPFSAPISVPYEVNRSKLELKKGLF